MFRGSRLFDRPATYTSLFPSNRGEPTKFGMGPKKTTTRTESGEIRTNLDLGTKTPEGMESVAHPIETDRNIEQVLGKRTSQQRQIEAIRIQFQVPGDSAREVGDLIHFSYPSDKAEGRESGQIQEHKYLGGKYLITALRHKITGEEYEMIVEASKDSYLSEPTSGYKPSAPKIQSPDGSSYMEST